MKYFIIAGEASGDLHASNLMSELKKQDSKAEFCFLGGDLMLAQGGTMIQHYRNMAFMGIVNVVLNIRKVLHNIRICKESICRFQPDVVILVDYPSFNLKIAKFVKRTLGIPVYYYISPKIWAWKEYRIKSIKKLIDEMFCILPFEVDFYKKHQYPIHYVGNPTMDSIRDFQQKNPRNPSEFCAKNNIPSDKPIVALLAGSRKQEIVKCLPKMLKMKDLFPDFQFVIAGAPSYSIDFYKQFRSEVPIVFNRTFDLVQNSEAAIVNSGTATLETALLKTPEVVVYHVFGGRLASLLKKILIRVPFVSLVNLIADKEVVKELIAHHFTEKRLQQELQKILFDKAYRNNQQLGFESVIEKLGDYNCAETTAKLIVEKLQR